MKNENRLVLIRVSKDLYNIMSGKKKVGKIQQHSVHGNWVAEFAPLERFMYESVKVFRSELKYFSQYEVKK